ncbi:trypsin-like peptidase domain-containing protein [Maricaulis sp.]|uniref:trypsin-like peptidase domain-containing protein n=1 Tax=Maricaulis sp. TaxID=1486257 RepID=UPI00262647AB|nr:trypsin-like peptidase domain-containing protein [Maricaulis sp.]
MYRVLFPVLMLILSVPVSAQDWTGIAQRTMDASVSVYVESRRQSAFEDIPADSPLARFGDLLGEAESEPRLGESAGSGFLISADGLVVTNYHVIDRAHHITVAHQGVHYPARLVGADATSDLAVLRIARAEAWPYLRISGEVLEVGQPVAAVGDAFGLGLAFKAGLVAALDRELAGARPSPVGYIQSSLAINRGDAGGPLVNAAGDVVGINQAIFSQTGQAMGVSFHIPASELNRVLPQLIETGRVRRGDLGVAVQVTPPELMRASGLGGQRGLVVTRIFSGSAAERGGLREGDIILAVDGEPVPDTSSLMRRVQRAAPGHSASVRIMRDDAMMMMDIALGERPAEPLTLYLGTTEPVAAEDYPNALIVSGLALGQGSEGVVVLAGADVYLGGGLVVPQPGDVLVSLDGAPVRSLADVERLLRSSRQSRAAVFTRQGDRFTATLSPQ